ncbi:MAG: ribonuclease H-like domain-containing protein [Chitinivibrionia bacterium]|nr:ribonuclease H-like domain-containing protein [Chitinivibrionia bacterium]
MENKLRKRLEILKARAKRFGRTGAEQLAGGGRPPEASYSDETADGAGDDRWIDTEAGVFRALDEACPGRVRETPAGPCYLTAADGLTIDDSAGQEAARFERSLAESGSLLRVFKHRPESGAGGASSERICFFDIETAGLTPNTYVFLCGVMSLRGGSFHIEQVLARDYPEEKALLHHLRDMLEPFDYVVTFNGLAFDMPFIRTRMAVNRIESRERFETLDLLGPTRREFSRKLPNCKLTTVERHLTGKTRTGDVPGRDIPRVYHDFVETGNARLLSRVLYHNRMDLLAMAVILNELMENALYGRP